METLFDDFIVECFYSQEKSGKENYSISPKTPITHGSHDGFGELRLWRMWIEDPFALILNMQARGRIIKSIYNLVSHCLPCNSSHNVVNHAIGVM